MKQVRQSQCSRSSQLSSGPGGDGCSLRPCRKEVVAGVRSECVRTEGPVTLQEWVPDDQTCREQTERPGPHTGGREHPTLKPISTTAGTSQMRQSGSHPNPRGPRRAAPPTGSGLGNGGLTTSHLVVTSEKYQHFVPKLAGSSSRVHKWPRNTGFLNKCPNSKLRPQLSEPGSFCPHRPL